ncbi:MAG: BrnT family toxin [Desulfatirhabdiaceae bacterium]
MHYHFEWDPHKAELNIRNHKIGFHRAASVFKDPLMMTIFDDDHSQDEKRWITMGHDDHGIILVISHTFQIVNSDEHVMIRIISARKATKRERRQYGG